MPNGENPFITNEQALEAATPINPQPQTEVNLQHIGINEISGPLVILFGPRNIGKTVTLVRLCNYLNRYEIRPNEDFRPDRIEYRRTIDAFEAIINNPHFAPGATGNINFLLLDVTYQGHRFCQILEAPGEHFFDAENPAKGYPYYLNQILNSSYRKIFLLFFELNMFTSDRERRNYADKIARLVSEKIDPKRDGVVIVCNKCDLHQFMRNGLPIKSEFQNAIYKNAAYSGLIDVLKTSGLREVAFVPFSAGTFTDDGTGHYAFAPSNDYYPKSLWTEVHNCVKGKSGWKLW